MAKYGYSMKLDGEKSAMASGRSLKISPKMSVEICNFLRGKPAERAVVLLDRVIGKKEAVPLRRFNRDIGHKRNTGPGRYPIKASREIRAIIKSAMANAQLKGLNQSSLIIKHICAQKGSENPRYGRHRSREAKRTHIEVIVMESATKKKKEAQEKKGATKQKPGEVKEKPKAPEKVHVPKEDHKKKETKEIHAAKPKKSEEPPVNKASEKKEGIKEKKPKGGGKENEHKKIPEKSIKAVKKQVKEAKND